MRLMTGIVFFRTRRLDEIVRFYTEQVGCELWMDQGTCKILRHGGFLFGFCDGEEAETNGVLTFVYGDRGSVDFAYELFAASAVDPPREHPCFPIYNFFSRDPEGRLIEFQVFTNQPDWSMIGAPGSRCSR
jgi:catechol 2,3-dioxygenase-like lactoylglutathione lyase family enzyme